jgi:hypothetical protein
MVLLHHRVVPGLGGGVRPRPEAVVVEAGQVPCGDRDRAQVEPAADGAPTPTAAAVPMAASAPQATLATLAAVPATGGGHAAQAA